jgi:hypothetical protein
MKPSFSLSRAALTAVPAGSAWLTAGTALAQEAYVPPAGAHAMQVDWHGDRYWDGHRYWARDEWMRRHPVGWEGGRYWDGHRYWARDERMRGHPHDDPRHHGDDRRRY